MGQRPRLLRLTPALRSRILEMILEGVPLTTASIANGIPKRTFFDWLEKGRAEDAIEPYRTFAAEVVEAQERWAASTVRQINAATAKDWRAGMTLLERQRPSEWGDPNRAGAVTVNVGVIVESPEWRALSERLLVALAPFPEALDAVLGELGGGQVVEGDAVEVGELAA